MIRKLVFSLLVMMAASAAAQKLQTVDKDGNPVPYASIVSEDGNIIGTTDLNGILNDVKGAEVVSITHVAYKSKKVKVGQGGRIALEDADFGLPEITVTKKPLVYAQTYYRIYYTDDYPDFKVCYYRAGVVNNSYDRKTKKISSDEDHFSACNMGIFKTALNLAMGQKLKRLGGLSMGKVEDRMKRKWKDIGITFSPDGPGKQRITDRFGLVGSVVDNHDKGERRYSYDGHLMAKHQLQVAGTEKKKAKAQKREERQSNRVDQDYVVYRIDDQGNYSPEDFVVHQVATSYDDVTRDDSISHVNFLVQIFTTDRAYVTKDELKQLKKANKMKMNYQNLAEFERTHNIPALPAELQKRIREVVK